MTPTNRDQLIALMAVAIAEAGPLPWSGKAQAVLDAMIAAGLAVVPVLSNAAIGDAILYASSQHTAWDRAITTGRVDGGRE